LTKSQLTKTFGAKGFPARVLRVVFAFATVTTVPRVLAFLASGVTIESSCGTMHVAASANEILVEMFNDVFGQKGPVQDFSSHNTEENSTISKEFMPMSSVISMSVEEELYISKKNKGLRPTDQSTHSAKILDSEPKESALSRAEVMLVVQNIRAWTG
jgi:hypothetical protein